LGKNPRNQIESDQPLWDKEAVLDQHSNEEKQKPLDDHHKDIPASDVPTEWISDQVLAWKRKRKTASDKTLFSRR